MRVSSFAPTASHTSVKPNATTIKGAQPTSMWYRARASWKWYRISSDSGSASASGGKTHTCMAMGDWGGRAVGRGAMGHWGRVVAMRPDVGTQPYLSHRPRGRGEVHVSTLAGPTATATTQRPASAAVPAVATRRRHRMDGNIFKIKWLQVNRYR